MRADIKNTLVGLNSTVRDALTKLGKSSYLILFLTDDSGAVIGSITDGDIRRAFLKGITLESPIDAIAKKDFIWAGQKATKSQRLELLKKYGVRQLPILDSQKHLIDIVIIDEFLDLSFCDVPAVIMAGGKGTRLLPYTESTPKPLLKVGDKPIIETLVASLASKGVTEIYISVNYLAEQIKDHFGDGSSLGVKITYIEEPHSMGTAGSLSLLKNTLTKDFFVFNADVLSDIDLPLLIKFHQSNSAIATVCAKPFSMQVPYGVILTKQSDVLTIEEKPELSFQVSSGVYCFSPQVFEFIPEEQYLDMPVLIQQLLEKKKIVKCFHSDSPWIDIGSPIDFEKAQKHFSHIVNK